MHTTEILSREIFCSLIARGNVQSMYLFSMQIQTKQTTCNPKPLSITFNNKKRNYMTPVHHNESRKIQFNVFSVAIPDWTEYTVLVYSHRKFKNL